MKYYPLGNSNKLLTRIQLCGKLFFVFQKVLFLEKPNKTTDKVSNFCFGLLLAKRKSLLTLRLVLLIVLFD